MTTKDYKVDLGCCLEGSLPIRTFLTLIDEQKELFSSKELDLFFSGDGVKAIENMVVAPDGADAKVHRQCLELPIKLLQIPNAMWTAGRDIAEELVNQKVRYAEIRYVPQLHSQVAESGYKLAYEEEMLKAFLTGIENATKFSQTTINVNLSFLRKSPGSKDRIFPNVRTLFLTKKFLNKGICGINIDEFHNSDVYSEFGKFFEALKEQRLPFTVHAGELKSKCWDLRTLKNMEFFGAKRIGFSSSFTSSKELIQAVKDFDFTVECYADDILRSDFSGELQHPIKVLYDEGVNITFNSGNMTLDGNTLDSVYNLARGIGFSDDDIRKIQLNGISGALISKTAKKKIVKKEGLI